MGTRIFYKEGFYFDGININIPSDAVEINKDYYDTLIKDMSEGRVIVTSENGFPISEYPLDAWKEDKLKEIEAEFKFIVSEYPILYPENGLYYLPEYANDYINLLPKYFDESVELNIWDASDKIENVRKFKKEELINLIKFLSETYENAYQIKKEKKSLINNLDAIDESIKI